jgi:endo-1,4-beta-D-glucanase Y
LPLSSSLGPASSSGSRRVPVEDKSWRAYKQSFIAADGRVIDTGNKGVSHTEGQGYAMVLATAYDDRATFDRVWTWTRATLHRPDGLFSWRYVPGAAEPIPDPNNATDGDLLICWGLLRAAAKWQQPEYRDEALTIAAALRRAVVATESNDAYLLPAAQGFVGPGKRVVNLSYWIFPALAEIGASTGDPVWNQVMATGLRLIRDARFGAHNLPPDWLETSGTLRPADGFAPRFGYDATRIPLYLIWGGLGDQEHIGAIAAYWKITAAAGSTPAWVDLDSGGASPERQSPGMDAVKRLTLATSGQPLLSSPPPAPPTTDYYSASLLPLAKLAGAAGAQR